MVKVVGIRFRNAGKIYYFGPGKLQLKAGMHAIVETARGVPIRGKCPRRASSSH